jgi:hypothetical protein
VKVNFRGEEHLFKIVLADYELRLREALSQAAHEPLAEAHAEKPAHARPASERPSSRPQQTIRLQRLRAFFATDSRACERLDKVVTPMLELLLQQTPPIDRRDRAY